jgi:hypothetical protein
MTTVYLLACRLGLQTSTSQSKQDSVHAAADSPDSSSDDDHIEELEFNAWARQRVQQSTKESSAASHKFGSHPFEQASTPFTSCRPKCRPHHSKLVACAMPSEQQTLHQRLKTHGKLTVRRGCSAGANGSGRLPSPRRCLGSRKNAASSTDSVYAVHVRVNGGRSAAIIHKQQSCRRSSGWQQRGQCQVQCCQTLFDLEDEGGH